MIVMAKYLIPRGYCGLAIYPFVFLKHKTLIGDKVLINHETIHLRQQFEMLILPFFIWYFTEFCFRLIQYKNGYLAYRNISFEREAFSNEHDLRYLKKRRFWNFLKYCGHEV